MRFIQAKHHPHRRPAHAPPYNLCKDYGGAVKQRLERAGPDKRIQGYSNGVFWARNTGSK